MIQRLFKQKNLIFTLNAAIFLFLIFLINTVQEKVKAADNGSKQFTIDYDISYNIQENGEAHISQNITITNLQNDMVPTTYSFTAKQIKIFDVTAQTNGKEVKPQIEENNSETKISATIDNFAIGEGRQNKINLTYKTTDIALKTGDIWNIYIPKIQIPETTTLYNIKLMVPQSFGPKIFISPTPIIEKTEDGKNVYYLTKETFGEKGITASFGKYQNLNFKIKYQISNTWFLPRIIKVALPPNIEDMQQVSYTSFSKKPLKINTDTDGNVLASYFLWPRQGMEVEVSGSARISGKQINPDFGRDFNELPKDILNKYTVSQPFWDVNASSVKTLAKELKDENVNVIKNAKKIYEYIVKNLKYDFEAVNKTYVERQGAETVLTTEGSWTCMEFTDVFVATARAMGIPAREVNGYAFTNEGNKPVSVSLKGGDLLHAWPEFYDPFYGWVQIDPTWGATSGIDYFTKLDTNHFAFVVKGLNSEEPYPAGSYRFNDYEKLVDVDFSQTENEEAFKEKIEGKKVFGLNLVEIFKGNRSYKITNNGGTFLYDVGGQVLSPGASTTVYLPKNNPVVKYMDSNKNVRSLEL